MEFTILLSRSSKYWSYRHGPLCLVLTIPAILCDLNLNSPDNSNTEEFFKDFLAKEIFFIFFFFLYFGVCACKAACLHVWWVHIWVPTLYLCVRLPVPVYVCARAEDQTWPWESSLITFCLIPWGRLSQLIPELIDLTNLPSLPSKCWSAGEPAHPADIYVVLRIRALVVMPTQQVLLAPEPSPSLKEISFIKVFLRCSNSLPLFSLDCSDFC